MIHRIIALLLPLTVYLFLHQNYIRERLFFIKDGSCIGKSSFVLSRIFLNIPLHFHTMLLVNYFARFTSDNSNMLFYLLYEY
jgi:hypothetical protein